MRSCPVPSFSVDEEEDGPGHVFTKKPQDCMAPIFLGVPVRLGGLTVGALTALLLLPAFSRHAAGSQAGTSDPDRVAAPASPDSARSMPPVATDALLLGGGTVAYALAAPWIRPHFLEHFSLARVQRNLTDPVGRLGVTKDDDGFFHNYVSHPVVWGGLGLVLRNRGYGRWGALAMTQAHSVWWEYVVEGAWKPPSKVDVLTNFVSPVVTIFALHPLAMEVFEAEETDDRGGSRFPVRIRPVVVGTTGSMAWVVSVSLP